MSVRHYHRERNTTEYTVSATIPLDDTTPLITEGVEIFSESFTPTESDSDIIIAVELQVDISATGYPMTVAMFEDSTCIASLIQDLAVGRNTTVALKTKRDAVSTTARTYSIRVGSTNAGFGKVSVNDDRDASTGHNDNEGSLFEITEYAP